MLRETGIRLTEKYSTLAFQNYDFSYKIVTLVNKEDGLFVGIISFSV